MTLLTVTKRSGEQVQIEANTGSVMEALRSNDVGEIQALCGGALACATCHVFVDSDDLQKLPAASRGEKDLVETSEYFQPNSRLSCQIILSVELETLSVKVAPEE